MPAFTHELLACGPHHEYLLQQVECARCRWHAVGKLFALTIAEKAHHCLSEEDAPTTPPHQPTAH